MKYLIKSFADVACWVNQHSIRQSLLWGCLIITANICLAQSEWDKRQDTDIKDNRQALTNYATADSKLQAELETKITIYESILGSIGVAVLGIGVWYIKKRIDK